MKERIKKLILPVAFGAGLLVLLAMAYYNQAGPTFPDSQLYRGESIDVTGFGLANQFQKADVFWDRDFSGKWSDGDMALMVCDTNQEGGLEDCRLQFGETFPGTYSGPIQLGVSPVGTEGQEAAVMVLEYIDAPRPKTPSTLGKGL